MQIARLGDGLAVPLSLDVIEALDLREGDEVTLRAVGPGALEVERSRGAADLLTGIRRHRGRLPADFRLDRDEAAARGNGA